MVSRQSSMRQWRTQAHEKDLQRVFVFVAVGIGIAIGGHFNMDADIDPDTDSGDARCLLYLQKRNCLSSEILDQYLRPSPALKIEFAACGR